MIRVPQLWRVSPKRSFSQRAKYLDTRLEGHFHVDLPIRESYGLVRRASIGWSSRAYRKFRRLDLLRPWTTHRLVPFCAKRSGIQPVLKYTRPKPTDRYVSVDNGPVVSQILD